MCEFNLNIEHLSDATLDRHWSRIVYLISSNLFVEMGVLFCIIYSYNSLKIDIRVPPKHVRVIRSNIGPESVEKCRDVQMSKFEPISGKKLRVFS
jgi:hypothetical protein